MTSERQLGLGFACSWWQPRASTWSYTPTGLLQALHHDERVTVTELDAQRSLVGKASLAAAHALLSRNAWKYGRANRWMTTQKVRRATKRASLDAVLAVGDAEPRLSTPTFFYQDMGFGVALENIERLGSNMPNLLRASRRRLDQLAAEQVELYAASTGIFTMGKWFAEWLVERGGVPEQKVHAIGGGLNAVPSRRRLLSREVTRRRLLFVGRDFFRKGGDIVVEAVSSLRLAGEEFTLTVVGPARWPLDGAPPSWLDFRGPGTPEEVAEIWAEHDLFVLPSWFEAYGLVFLEARAAGLPCIGRRAFAMPELVPDGLAGRLIPEDGGAKEVAEAIFTASTDRAMFDKVGAEAKRVAEENCWTAVASRALAVIEQSIR